MPPTLLPGTPGRPRRRSRTFLSEEVWTEVDMRDDVAEPRAVDEHGGRPLLAYHGVLAWSRLRGDEIVVEPYLERITGRGGRRAV